jgi:CubicO group peptidase (beta-lactamase class C family)
MRCPGMTIACLLGFFLAGSAAAFSGDQSPSAGGLLIVDRLVMTFIADHQVPGAALAIVKDGRLVYVRGFGFADRKQGCPVNPRSLFRIASVSKPFTAAAIMGLVEKGRLRLDAPVLQLLPEAIRGATGVPGDHRLADVTVRHLLQHTAGWDRARSGFFPLRSSSLAAICRQAGIPPPGSPDTVVAHMLSQPLDFSPGTRFAYANIGYLVLGRLITAVSGASYEDYVRHHVLLPLGIIDMHIGASSPEDLQPGEVCYYSAFDATVEAAFGPLKGQRVALPYSRSMKVQEAAGGWVASVVDLARFLTAMHAPGPHSLLGENTRRQMVTPMPADASASQTPHAVSYALGWFVEHDDQGRRIVYHGGRLPGSGAYIGWRSDGLGVAVLFNCDTDRRNRPLVRLFLRALAPVVDSITPWPEHDLFPLYFP